MESFNSQAFLWFGSSGHAKIVWDASYVETARIEYARGKTYTYGWKSRYKLLSLRLRIWIFQKNSPWNAKNFPSSVKQIRIFEDRVLDMSVLYDWRGMCVFMSHFCSNWFCTFIGVIMWRAKLGGLRNLDRNGFLIGLVYIMPFFYSRGHLRRMGPRSILCSLATEYSFAVPAYSSTKTVPSLDEQHKMKILDKLSLRYFLKTYFFVVVSLILICMVLDFTEKNDNLTFEIECPFPWVL